ncbi:MAG: low molecular weight protein-tyrosine-phosphatase [Chromatiaceae bacterium]
MSEATRVRILFVCMGNICRSPTAEGVFRHLLRGEGYDGLIATDSAGTHGYHIGEPPDERARETARRRGIDLSDLRARRVAREDFDLFDYILAMDQENHQALRAICPPVHRSKLRLFMDFAPDYGIREVPDPYYGSPGGFEQVFDLVEAAALGLLEDIRQRWR